MPLLTPARYSRFALLGLVLAGAAGIIEALQASPLGPANGMRAFVAAALGWAVIGLALTLPGVTWRGLVLGGFFVGAGIVSWSFSTEPGFVWALLLVEGAVFAAWSLPWLRDLVRLPKLGMAWLGLAYWFLGTLGALFSAHWTVAAQRVVYGGLFTLGALAALAVIRKTRRDPTPAIAAAFLLAIGALLMWGSGNALDDIHAVPTDTTWGNHMEYRFWGGPGLLYHPNSIVLISVLVSLRIAPDRLFAAWQRYAVLGVTVLMMLLVTSRTGFFFALAAAGLHALAVLLKRIDYRRAVVAIVVPFVLLGGVLTMSGGITFLTETRYPGADQSADATSGRKDTWKQVITDFKGDSLGEQIFGNADNARGTVDRVNSVAVLKPGQERPKLTTDNAFFGSLRRAGVTGVLAFLVGVFLLVRRALRRDTPVWFAITALAVIPTIATSDWLLGGTGGTLWILLLAGEAWLAFGRTESPAA